MVNCHLCKKPVKVSTEKHYFDEKLKKRYHIRCFAGICPVCDKPVAKKVKHKTVGTNVWHTDCYNRRQKRENPIKTIDDKSWKGMVKARKERGVSKKHQREFEEGYFAGRPPTFVEDERENPVTDDELASIVKKSGKKVRYIAYSDTVKARTTQLQLQGKRLDRGGLVLVEDTEHNRRKLKEMAIDFIPVNPEPGRCPECQKKMRAGETKLCDECVRGVTTDTLYRYAGMGFPEAMEEVKERRLDNMIAWDGVTADGPETEEEWEALEEEVGYIRREGRLCLVVDDPDVRETLDAWGIQYYPFARKNPERGNLASVRALPAFGKTRPNPSAIDRFLATGSPRGTIQAEENPVLVTPHEELEIKEAYRRLKSGRGTPEDRELVRQAKEYGAILSTGPNIMFKKAVPLTQMPVAMNPSGKKKPYTIRDKFGMEFERGELEPEEAQARALTLGRKHMREMEVHYD